MLGSILVALGLSILARNVGLIDDRGLVLASLTSVGMVLIASFAIRRHKPWAKKKATFHGALGLVFLSVGITVYLDPAVWWPLNLVVVAVIILVKGLSLRSRRGLRGERRSFEV
ncbi:MAG: hypothetical protein DRJ62_00710 [Thermoprotei archaeon]|nr:MAG: hypothetical protein DRJ62_00710 [Thermoprotei archaeon]